MPKRAAGRLRGGGDSCRSHVMYQPSSAVRAGPESKKSIGFSGLRSQARCVRQWVLDTSKRTIDTFKRLLYPQNTDVHSKVDCRLEELEAYIVVARYIQLLFLIRFASFRRWSPKGCHFMPSDGRGLIRLSYGTMVPRLPGA